MVILTCMGVVSVVVHSIFLVNKLISLVCVSLKVDFFHGIFKLHGTGGGGGILRKNYTYM